MILRAAKSSLNNKSWETKSIIKPFLSALLSEGYFI